MAWTNNEHFVSQLPIFEVTRSKDYKAWFIVICPRDDCGQTFLVLGSAWRKNRVYTDIKGNSHTINGRSCPYCFRPSRVPSGRVR